jgi:Fe-Mn family superoxide dismutase
MQGRPTQTETEREKIMSHYTLPNLPYDYSALEPHISERIMELHHGKHHAGYVNKANKTAERLAEARSENNVAVIGAVEQQLAFNVSGHILHALFWNNLHPEQGREPTGELAEQLSKDFGSFTSFRREMNETAASIMGSGWAALCWEPIVSRLVILQVHDHHTHLIQGAEPIMVLDAWEHGYYLQYENRKAEYLEAIWQVWNWPDIAGRLDNARSRDLHVPEAAAHG